MEKLFGPMEQVGIVVDNFEGPINHWTKNLKVGPFFILEHLELNDVYYNGNPSNIDFSVALAYSGDIQIELIKQHCETPSIYNDYVDNKKNSVHHFCTFTPNINDDLKILESQGYKNIQGGKTQDGGSFAYLDMKTIMERYLRLHNFLKVVMGCLTLSKMLQRNGMVRNAIMELGEISI